jgi:tetratricopeptide (TPR) repeat protein
LNRCQDALAPLTTFVDKFKTEAMPGLDKRLQGAAYYMGDCLMQLNRPKDAIPVLENAVNWSCSDADAMYKLSTAYAANNQQEKAVNMFVGATAFVPDYAEAYSAMATSYDALKIPTRATYARGMLAYSNKDFKNALPLLLQAAKADAGFPPILTGLGMTYEALNDYPNAKLAYTAALKLDPNNFSASTGIQRLDALLNK